MNASPSSRRVERIRHDTRQRVLEVLRTERISPGFLSVTLGGPDLQGFTSLSFDDHIKIFLEEEAPTGEDSPPEPGARRIMRDYTPRRFDAMRRELVVEFALHGDGAATTWAAQASPGQRVRIGGPRGSFVVPNDYDFHLLIGDETALPAISRRLEELPARAKVLAFVQTADPADQRDLSSRARVDVTWTGGDPDALIDAIGGLTLPDGEGFAWAAGEARVIAAIRVALVATHGLDKDHIRAAAYWKRGVCAHHETLSD